MHERPFETLSPLILAPFRVIPCMATKINTFSQCYHVGSDPWRQGCHQSLKDELFICFFNARALHVLPRNVVATETTARYF